MLERVQQTWNELGYKVKATQDRLFVRLRAMPEKTEGGIYLPPDRAALYGVVKGANCMVRGTVLSVGRDVCGVDPGDDVCFARLYFARFGYAEDRTAMGWVKQEWVFGIVDNALGDIRFVA